VTSKRRRQQGTGALYRTSAGLWRGAVDLGYGPDGKRRRKVVSGKDRNDVTRRLNALRAQVAAHQDVATAAPTAAEWFTTWLDEVAASRVRPRTLDTYRGYVDRYIAPTLGKRKLDAIRPEHIRQVHAAITGAGLSTTTARQAHAIIVRAFADARREGHPCLDVADRMSPPPRAASTRGALTADEAVTFLRSTAGDPLWPRWAMAFLTGARQGECLGLEWDRVDFDRLSLDLAWQLQRLPHRHGCDPACGRRRAGNCPDRVLAVPPGFEARPTDAPSLYLTRPKSRAGKRRVPMVPALAEALSRMPHDGPLVFTRPNGLPIDPKDDSAAWHAALDAAGLPKVPLHAARHTTATLLRNARADQRTIMAIMGHASEAVLVGYQHEDDTLSREAIGRLGGLLALD